MSYITVATQNALYDLLPEKIRKKGTRAMNTIDRTIHRNEEEFPSFDVTDEALEGAAAAEAIANFTYPGCTALTYCPEY